MSKLYTYDMCSICVLYFRKKSKFAFNGIVLIVYHTQIKTVDVFLPIKKDRT